MILVNSKGIVIDSAPKIVKDGDAIDVIRDNDDVLRYLDINDGQIIDIDFSENTTDFIWTYADGVLSSEPRPIFESSTSEIVEESLPADKVQIVTDLKSRISSTDYMIIKAYEYNLVGLSIDYDIAALHNERQSLRDQINAIMEDS